MAESDDRTTRIGQTSQTSRVAPDTLLRPATGDELAGRFLLKEYLGRGSSGSVYSAFDRLMNRDVAIKVFNLEIADEKNMERLRREVRVASEGSHPNIAKIHDLHNDGRYFFLSMELVQGSSLSQLLREKEDWSFEKILSIGSQMALALKALHDKGIVHRDVKPGNIILTEDGTAKLCDLGLARMINQDATLTATNVVLGTPDYMAPEQAMAGELTAAVDIYALGITLYRALTVEVPLKEDTTFGTLMTRQKSRLPRIRNKRPEIPKWFERLLRRMTEPKPGERIDADSVLKTVESRKILPKVRKRWIAAAILLPLIAVGSLIGYRAMRRGATVDYRVEGARIMGLDREGKTTWSVNAPSSKISYLRGDITGDGKLDIVAFTRTRLDGSYSDIKNINGPLWIGAISSDGRYLTNIDLKTYLKTWVITFSRSLDQKVWLSDIDGDGIKEIVVTVHQTTYYPSALLVYWPVMDTWELVMTHFGWIDNVTSIRNKSEGGRLLFTAKNNRLALMRVVGIISLQKPVKKHTFRDVSENMVFKTFPLSHHYSKAKLLCYVPLGQAEFDKPVLEGDPHAIGGIVKWKDGGKVTSLDKFYNPIPGPNAGRDLVSDRLEVMLKGGELEASLESGDPDNVLGCLAAFKKAVKPLLNETPYRNILLLTGARSLADIGKPEEALALIQKESSSSSCDDVLMEKATLLALTGRLVDAREVLRSMVKANQTVHCSFDASVNLIRVAIELKDKDLTGEPVARFGNSSDCLVAEWKRKALFKG